MHYALHCEVTVILSSENGLKSVTLLYKYIIVISSSTKTKYFLHATMVLTSTKINVNINSGCAISATLTHARTLARFVCFLEFG